MVNCKKINITIPENLLESIDTRTLSRLNQGEKKANRSNTIAMHLEYALNDSLAVIKLYTQTEVIQ